MEAVVFTIKSMFVQNLVMLSVAFLLGGLIFWAAITRRPKHLVAGLIWAGIVLWFFNSPFFGFSQATVSPSGIALKYGILSFRNITLPLDTKWSIESRSKGIMKLKKVYFIRIGRHVSMRVGARDKGILLELGKKIDEMKHRNRSL